MPKPSDPADRLVQLEATVNDLEARRAELVTKFPRHGDKASREEDVASSKVHPSGLQQLISLSSVAAHSRPLPESQRERSIRGDGEAATVLVEANAVMQRHIKLLQDYNAVKDVAQGLMGILADKRGVRLVDIMDDLGVGTEE